MRHLSKKVEVLKLAILKKSEINKLNEEEIVSKVNQLINDYNREVAAKKVPGKSFNHGKAREIRKTIARLLTRYNLLTSARQKEAKNKQLQPAKPKK